MIRIRNVTRSFGKTTAVDDVSIDIQPGQMVGVIGRSGAGKSTLLRMINRLVDPTKGSISFGATEVSGLAGAALRRWQRDCAMIFQQFNLVPRLDVLTNVLLGRLNHRSTRPQHSRPVLPRGTRHGDFGAGAPRHRQDGAAARPARCPAASSSAWRSPGP